MSGLCDTCHRVLYDEDLPRCPECVVEFGPAPHEGYWPGYGDAPVGTVTGGDRIKGGIVPETLPEMEPVAVKPKKEPKEF